MAGQFAGLPIPEDQYAELTDASRHLDALEDIGEDLIVPAVPTGKTIPA